MNLILESPFIPLKSALRLLGFLTGSADDALQVDASRRSCARTLGLSDAAVDSELLDRMRLALAWRQLSMPAVVAQESLLIAGSLAFARPLSLLMVDVHEASLSGKPRELLGTVKVTSEGQFVLDCPRKGDVAMLVVRSKEDGHPPVHTSSPFRVEPEMWFEWSESGGPVPSPGRFDVREALLSGMLAGEKLTLHELVDHPESKAMIDGLRSLSGLPASVIRRHVVAAKLSHDRELGLPSSVIGTLMGPLGEEQRLLDDAFSPSTIPATPEVDGWVTENEVRAAREFIVSSADSAPTLAIPVAIADGELSRCHFQAPTELADRAAGLRHSANLSKSPSENPWVALLRAKGLKDEVVAIAADHLRAGRKDDALASVAGLSGGAVQPDVRATIELGDLAAHDGGLISAMSGHSARSIARMSADELRSVLRMGGTVSGALDLDVEGIQQRAEEQFPSDSLLRRRMPKFGARVRQFISRSGDQLDLDKAPVRDQCVQDSGGYKDNIDESVIAELSQVQRVGRLTCCAHHADALLDAGYGSAQEIALADREAFVATVAKHGLPADAAVQVHRRARARYRASVELYLQVDPTSTAAQIAALGGLALAGANRVSVPTYAYLFGSQDFGPVEDWESVVGQPAYFVDLMVWLQRAPDAQSAQKPYEVLIARRPDLTGIVLDKRNAETLVPHIDLVCELLEDAAAKRLNVAVPAGVRQTTRSAEEIRAYPEHVNGDVYDALAANAATMRLPFDLPLEEVRRYLQLKTVQGQPLTRARVLEMFGADLGAVDATGSPTQSALDLAAEVIGLNSLELTTIATAKPQDAQKYWGNGTIQRLDKFLSRAPSFTHARETLTYDEALSLFSVGLGGTSRLRLADGITVDRCKAEDRVFDPPLKPESLDVIHRSLRLTKRLGAKMPEIQALIAAGGGTLGKPSLVTLAGLLRVRDLTGFDFEQCAALFRDFAQEDIKTRVDATLSLYRRVYLRRTDGAAIPKVFLDGAAASSLTNHQERIAAALGIPADQFGALCTIAGVSGGNVTFNTLSTLYRHALLAQAAQKTGLVQSIADYAALIAVVAATPFANVFSLLRFLEAPSLVRTANLSLTDLQLLTGATALAIPALAEVDPVIGQLRESTQAVLKASGAPADAAAVTAAILAAGSWVDGVGAWLRVDSRLANCLQGYDRETAKVLVDPAAAGRNEAAARVARFVVTVDHLKIAPGDAPALGGVLGELVAGPSWQRLREVLMFLALAKRVGSAPALAKCLQSIVATESIAAVTKRLAAVTGMEAARVEQSWRAVDPQDPPSTKRTATFLHRVLTIAEASAAVGVTPAALRGLIAWPKAADAMLVRDAVRSTLPSSSWFEISKKIQDPLREAKRDALVDCVVNIAAPGPQDPKVPEPTSVSEFSARFLIDVEMGDCRDTSRIVQAAAAVQTLLQRCLLGLEGPILPKNPESTAVAFWREWEWRKRYRLWEANRRIFLYPEAFLALGNRPGVSPLFLDFEKKVSETEITEASVAAALEDYLVGLEKIARLDYRALDTDKSGKVLGVIASSASTPPAHYYRYMSGGIWAPWEEVSLGPTTTSLTVAQGLTRAWVVWPTTSEHMHPNQETPKAEPGMVIGPDNHGKGLSYARYSWTMRDDRGVWTAPKTTSRAVLMTPRDRRNFVLAARPDDPSPYVFQLILLTSDTVSDTPAASASWTSTMEIVRDATRSYVQPDMSFGAGKAPNKDWGEHYGEYRLSSPISRTWKLSAWSPLYFDGNRMVTGTSDADVDVAVPVVPGPNQPAVSTKLFSARTPVTATKPRATVLLSDGQAPQADAFVLNGSLLKEAPATVQATNWSCFVLSFAAASALLPPRALTDLNLPSGKFLAVSAYHPFASELLSYVRAGSIGLVYDASLQLNPSAAQLKREPRDLGVGTGANTATIAFLVDGKAVGPAAGAVKEAFDFHPLAPYSLYNWELFFFTPLFVAQRLASVRRFKEAQAFYHFVFNPLSTENSTTAERFWVTKPLRQAVADASIEVMIEQDVAAKRDSFQVIADHPFDPHAVAAFRNAAYQKYVVRSYIDNLIGWGDQLYRSGTKQNSREDVDEAATIYQLAESILGKAPNMVRPIGEKKTRAFVQASDWVGGGNLLVELENSIRQVGEVEDDVPIAHLPVLASDGSPVKSLYFRVPPDQSLLDYWTKVASRLDNVRSCKTIDGAVANLPLAGAPIDPRALADAAALGLSVADALAMAASDPPPFRFTVLLSRAREACTEVQQLGAALFSALEKRDGEHLARIRLQFEEPVLRATRAQRVAARRQQDEEIFVLQESGWLIDAREAFYSGREYMNDLERAALALSITAGILDGAGAILDLTSGGLQLIPDVTVGLSGFGGSPTAVIQYGGTTVAGSTSKWAQGMSKLGGLLDRIGGIVTTQAAYARRKEDWDFEASQAALQRQQLERQLVAARLRLAVIDAELQGQDAQESAWRQNERLLREKFTNRELYAWQVDRVMEIYRRAHDQAMRLAALARECFAFESGDKTIARPDRTGWDSSKSGLLAGESLQRYLRDLETQYYERRPFDRVVTQHVSLSQVAPLALSNLVSTGSTAEFTIPTWWFKRLYPGIRGRRIKSLAVSIPAVGGPYTNVNATVRLVGTNHAISLSSGTNDYGWDLSQRESMYLPFEGASLDSDTRWLIAFPDGARDIDVTTISDVVLHIEYTALEGADGATPPAEQLFFVDAARAAPDAWACLIAAAGTQASSFKTDDLIPSFLQGYAPSGVNNVVALDDKGTIIPGALAVEVRSGGEILMTPVAGVNVPWATLRHLLLVLKVSATTP